jgi:hypothetical protein
MHFMIVFIIQAHAVLCEIRIKCFVIFRETHAKTDRLSIAEWLVFEKELTTEKESQEQLLGTL